MQVDRNVKLKGTVTVCYCAGDKAMAIGTATAGPNGMENV